MIAWVFPGQGSQYTGMGSGLSGLGAKETFAIADAALDRDLGSVCFDGPDEVLSATEVSQPAILTVSVAALRSLYEAGHLPDIVAGHSVGEFAALVAAHAIAFEDALRAVAVRADAMGRAGRTSTGAMAAILGLTLDQVEAACHAARGPAGIAAINGPSQIVVSGERQAVARVTDAARAAGARRVIPLDVSVAAHSTLMEPSVGELRRVLDGVTILPPSIPFVSSVSGRIEEDPERIAELLCAALTRPVRWVDAVETVAGAGATRFLEVGPGRVVSGLMRGILPDAHVSAVGDDDAITALAGTPVGPLA